MIKISLLVKLKNVRVLAPPTLFGIDNLRQGRPLTFPPIQPSNGSLRSIKPERRNVVVRARGCKISKLRNSVTGYKHKQGALLSHLLVVQKE